jgi:hypothetical protein
MPPGPPNPVPSWTESFKLGHGGAEGDYMKAFLKALKFAAATTAVLAMIVVSTAAMAIDAGCAGDRGLGHSHVR